MPGGMQSADIHDIKGLFTLYGWFFPAISLLALALAAIMAYLLWRRFRPRKAAPPPAPPAPLKTPREQLLETLSRLRGWLGTEDPKPFHFGLSEALRAYLEATEGLPATDRTTEEIVGLLPKSHPGRERILGVLRRTDQVKFTDYCPSREMEEKLLAEVEALVGGAP